MLLDTVKAADAFLGNELLDRRSRSPCHGGVGRGAMRRSGTAILAEMIPGQGLLNQISKAFDSVESAQGNLDRYRHAIELSFGPLPSNYDAGEIFRVQLVRSLDLLYCVHCFGSFQPGRQSSLAPGFFWWEFNQHTRTRLRSKLLKGKKWPVVTLDAEGLPDGGAVCRRVAAFEFAAFVAKRPSPIRRGQNVAEALLACCAANSGAELRRGDRRLLVSDTAC
jgi:hypothetical protein